jgi:hypothetical protein
LEDLRAKYPNDLFRSDKLTVKCLDCDIKPVNMTTKNGKLYTRNLEQHLNGKAHQDRVAARISREGKTSMMSEPSFSSVFQYGKPAFINFPVPQPIQCLSLPNLPASDSSGEPNLKQLRVVMNQYMDAFENDTASRRVRTTLLEQRQAGSERIQEERLEKLKESLTESDEKNQKLYNELEESLASHKQENKEQAQHMEDMILGCRQKTMDHGSSLKQLEGRLGVSDSRNQQQIDSMEQRLTKSDNKYFEVMGRLASFEQNSKQEAEELANRVDTLEERNQELVDGVLAQITAQVSESETGQRERTEGLLEQVASQVSDSEKRQKEQLQEIIHRAAASEGVPKDQMDSLAKELSSSQQYTKETLISIMHRILEKANETQCESINDLESQLQIHADELQRQRDSEEALRQSHFAQMDVHFNQSAERMQKLEKEIKDRIQAAESARDTRIKELEKEISERIQVVRSAGDARIKELEEVSEERERRINGYNEIFPLLFNQINELIETVECLRESVRTQKSRSRSPKPLVRRQTTRV